MNPVVRPTRPCGILLTGGTSVRMGVPKASARIGSSTCAQMALRALSAAADPVVCAGIDAGLPVERFEDAQQGPLAAFELAWRGLRARGREGAVLLLGCDLPLMEPRLLRWIAGQLDGYDAAVPVVNSQPQPLAACYGPGARLALDRGLESRNATSGSMRDLLGAIRVNYLPQAAWEEIVGPWALLDVNTPSDLAKAARKAG